jgi:tRNA modification GTPase
VAIATPAGAGALGVIRLSGPEAVTIAGALGKSPLDAQPSHTVRHLRLRDPESGATLGDAVCAVMRAPRSYTGEDVVELSCHGSPALLAMIVERLCQAGARVAAPGEFTRRAFVNGRLDLARAEAVALLIGARTERAVTLAARALDGDLGARVATVRNALLDLVAGLEVSLDFPDDEVGLAVDVARGRTQALTREVDALVDAGRRGRLAHDGVTIALVGRPNAGKSSLLNALLGQDRAIVAPTPGTTRDVVEGSLVVAGVAVRLLDMAGLGSAGDAIEAEGMRRARAAVDASDLVLHVVDGSVGRAEGAGVVITHPRIVAVRSKCDLPTHPDAASVAALAVSSITGQGVAALLERLTSEVRDIVGDNADEWPIATTLRQSEALRGIARSLRLATAALAEMPLEAALVDLHDALVTTSELLGVELGDAVVDRIFSTFCVGK